jgi:hypothetical protein
MDTVVSSLAGGLNGTIGAFADGVGSNAGLNHPFFSAIDTSGNIYYPDRENNRIRKVTPGGGIIIALHLAWPFAASHLSPWKLGLRSPLLSVGLCRSVFMVYVRGPFFRWQLLYDVVGAVKVMAVVG